jgi:hypothetical protein
VCENANPELGRQAAAQHIVQVVDSDLDFHPSRHEVRHWYRLSRRSDLGANVNVRPKPDSNAEL